MGDPSIFIHGCSACDYHLLVYQWDEGTEPYECAKENGYTKEGDDCYTQEEIKDIWRTADEEIGWDEDEINELRRIPTSEEVACYLAEREGN